MKVGRKTGKHEHHTLWPQIHDDKGALTKTYGVRAIPFALLVGRDGKIAAVNTSGTELEIAVKAALAKK